MIEYLKAATEKFKKGDYFLTATGGLKSPLKVEHIKISNNYPRHIVNSDGGVICIVSKDYKNVTWAEKCN